MFERFLSRVWRHLQAQKYHSEPSIFFQSLPFGARWRTFICSIRFRWFRPLFVNFLLVPIISLCFVWRSSPELKLCFREGVSLLCSCLFPEVWRFLCLSKKSWHVSFGLYRKKNVLYFSRGQCILNYFKVALLVLWITVWNLCWTWTRLPLKLLKSCLVLIQCVVFIQVNYFLWKPTWSLSLLHQSAIEYLILSILSLFDMKSHAQMLWMPDPFLYLCLLYLSEELYTLSTNLLNPSYNQSPESHFTMNHSWNRHEFGFRNICIPKMRASFVLICIALLPHYEIVSVFYCWNVSILWSFYITDKLLISCLWNKFKSCFRSFVSNPGVSLSNYCLLLSFHNLIILALWRTTIASLYLARTNLNLSLWSLSCRYILISCTHTHTFANAHTAYFLLTLLCCCQKENQIYAVSHITWRCLLIC